MTLLRWVSRGMFWISAYLCLPVILAVLFVDVILRYAFNMPFVWSQELCSFLLLVSLVFALPEAWLRNVHIKAEFMQGALTPTVKNWLARLTWLLLGVFSVLVALQTWKDGKLMILFGEASPELDLPIVWFRGIVGVAAALTALISLAMMFSAHPAQDAPESVE